MCGHLALKSQSAVRLASDMTGIKDLNNKSIKTIGAANYRPERNSMSTKKAKEAADYVNQNPKTSIERIKKIIPKYNLTLHRNQWIANFLKNLNQELRPSFIQLTDTDS